MTARISHPCGAASRLHIAACCCHLHPVHSCTRVTAYRFCAFGHFDVCHCDHCGYL